MGRNELQKRWNKFYHNALTVLLHYLVKFECSNKIPI